MDRTFVMIKPDGVQRGLVGEIISRLEAKGLKLVAARFEKLPEPRVTEQYKEHLSKPFFPSLKQYIMGYGREEMSSRLSARQSVQQTRRKPLREPSAVIMALTSAAMSFMHPIHRKVQPVRLESISNRRKYSRIRE
jgi:hypothetical protein